MRSTTMTSATHLTRSSFSPSISCAAVVIVPTQESFEAAAPSGSSPAGCPGAHVFAVGFDQDVHIQPARPGDVHRRRFV
jgi:hypothetical protein